VISKTPIALVLVLAIIAGTTYMHSLSGAVKEDPASTMMANVPKTSDLGEITSLLFRRVNDKGELPSDDNFEISLDGFENVKKLNENNFSMSYTVLVLPKHGRIRISSKTDKAWESGQNIYTLAIFIIDNHIDHANLFFKNTDNRRVLSRIGEGQWFYFPLSQKEIDLKEIDYSVSKLTDDEAYLGALAIIKSSVD
jgi:hypothetical protein